MKMINATDLDRKSGGAQWRDLRFSVPFLEMFFLQSVPGFPTSHCWQRLRMRFSSRKPHDVDQRHGSRQEIRGSVVEGPAVSFPRYSHTL
jgi:hypothetical protein